MKPRLSLANRLVISAYRRGYRIENGIPYRKDKMLKIGIRNQSRKYQTPVFSYRPPRSLLGVRRSFKVPIHRLLAYQKFRERIFEPGIQVRHLNGNPLDNTWDNIALGTGSENMMDRPEADRIEHAIHASRSQDRYHGEDFWDQVKTDWVDGMSYAALVKKHGVAKSTLSFHLAPLVKMGREKAKLARVEIHPVDSMEQSNPETWTESENHNLIEKSLEGVKDEQRNPV